MDVTLLRWPAEAPTRDRMAVAGEARLLLVEQDDDPPKVIDCLEDWIRVPAPEEDVRARVDAIAVRSQAHDPAPPGIDEDGVLRYEGAWVALPPLEARLTDTLLQRFGAVVGRDTLIRAVWPNGSPGRNALDVHVLRLRRRIAPLHLAVRTVRSRGYLIEAGPAAPNHSTGNGDDSANGHGNGHAYASARTAADAP
jgi:DNA-binding winged helix-turn-helix (wHTH) protein